MTLAPTRWLWVAIALVAVVLPLPPLAAWSGAADIGPIWAPHMMSWGLGLLVVVTVGLVAGRLGTRAPAKLRLRHRVPDGWYVASLAVVIALASTIVSWTVFAQNPHLIDEIAQLLHARAFAAGRLALPAPEFQQAFLTSHTWVADAGWISQYPPGHTALLAIGLLAGAEWLVDPVLGGLGTVFVFLTARGLYGRRVARAAAFLWAVSAWVMFMSASYMNHVGAVTLALLGWALVWGPRQLKWYHLIGAGLALACATAARPLDGLAAAVPVLVWAAHGRWRSIPWVVVGGVPVAIAWGYLNWRLHGSPWMLGYSLLYGAEHGLGFHIDPWGQPFTPAVALSNTAVAVRRLHLYLYEWPIPALLPLAIWAAFGRQRRERDLILAVGLIAAPVMYFFYWHSGFFLGPRFYYAIAPWLVIATARAWIWGWVLAKRSANATIRWDIALAGATVCVLLWGWTSVLPARVDLYRSGLQTFKLHPERALDELGVERALVLVPTSWGSRIISDLWAMGVKPGIVERAYRHIDACRLDRFRRRMRGSGTSSQEISDALEQMIRTQPVAVPKVPSWPDPTLRLVPGQPVSEACEEELRRDLAGFTLYTNLAWRNPVGLQSGIVYTRDLFEENDVLLAQYPGWPIWRFAPPDGDPASLPELIFLGPGGPGEQ